MTQARQDGISLKQWLPLIGLACCSFVFNTSEFMPIGLLTDIAASFSLTEAQAGIMISVYAWGVMLLSLPLMVFASRFEFKRMLLGVLAVWLRRGDRLYHSRPFLRFALWMGPSGLIAILAGWVTTEVGRQPWVVYGVQRTADAVSAHGDLHMSVSLLTFIVVYSAVFGVGYSYMLRLIRKGPQEMLPATTGTPARPLSAATEGYLQKESH